MPTYLLVSVIVCLSMLSGSVEALVKRFERDREDETSFNLTASPEFNIAQMTARGEPFCILEGKLVKCNPPINVRYQTPTAPPSQTDPQICVVYWNRDVSSEVQTGIMSYLTDLIGTDYFDGLSEYGMTHRPVLHPACGNGITLVPSRTDNDTCVEGSMRHRCVSERSMQQELYEQIRANVLPAPSAQVQYLVFFPYNVYSFLGDCARACGVHGAGQSPLGPIIYAALPDFVHSPNCQRGCMSMVNTAYDGMKVVMTHEIIEIITDPQPSTTSVTWYDLAWGEICDFCIYPGFITDKRHPVTHWWSNVNRRCMAYANANSSAQAVWHENAANANNPPPPPPPARAQIAPNPSTRCPAAYPNNCGTYCCPTGTVCHQGQCLALNHVGICPTGFSINCRNGYCCKQGQTCSRERPGYCSVAPQVSSSGLDLCPPEYPNDCGGNFGVCCEANQICQHITVATGDGARTMNVTLCLPPASTPRNESADASLAEHVHEQGDAVAGHHHLANATLPCPTQFPLRCERNAQLCCPSDKVCGGALNANGLPTECVASRKRSLLQ